ncbi:myo-inositol-1(or 4)-monophosphatase [Halogranum amylolyticum]|uniref:fructose-bisphosphatase n=1 Tax=Halogranum amylolyticum TaxID=660520 RepID=A0A1H8W8K1_9EURY|nr:inositol monophosphatase [Halogranum amylolyticum]SEP23972.1 myo-inositol-1(or 4)-monophosphatase [Halogranum amylolyticum]
MQSENPKQVAERAASAGAEVALSLFRTTLSVEEKSSQVDVVTEADRAAQERAIEIIREADPDAVVVAEEDDARKTLRKTGRAWIVDPIDGTTNFVHGSRIWTTSVALVDDGRSVAAANVAPALGDRYVADDETVTRNDDPVSTSTADDLQAFVVASTLRLGAGDGRETGALARLAVERFGEFRRIGSAQVTLSMVAGGELDAAVSTVEGPNAWDTVAGVHQIRCAGGIVTDLAGDPWRPTSEGLVASNGEAHEELCSAVRDTLDFSP